MGRVIELEARVLIAEDDPVIAEAVSQEIEARLGARVTRCHSLADTRRLAPSHEIVVLDLGLSDSSGLETLTRFRASVPGASVIVATARDGLEDRVAGLESGADDYVVKPYSAVELAARVRSCLRRRGKTLPAGGGDPEGRLVWDRQARQVRLAGDGVALTPLEYGVFAQLAGRPGVAVSRSDLLREVIGANFYGYERVIDVHVGHVRRKLDPANPLRYVVTVRGFGYRWDGPDLTGDGTDHAGA